MDIALWGHIFGHNTKYIIGQIRINHENTNTVFKKILYKVDTKAHGEFFLMERKVPVVSIRLGQLSESLSPTYIR